MMFTRACSWPKKPIVPYKRNKQGSAKATLKALVVEKENKPLVWVSNSLA
jgi:hypothetical protein